MKPEALRQLASNLEKRIRGMTHTGAVDYLGMKMALEFLKGLQGLHFPCHGSEANFDPRDRKTFRPLLRWFMIVCEWLAELDDSTEVILPGDADMATVNLLKQNGVTVTMATRSCRVMGFTSKEEYVLALRIIWEARKTTRPWRFEEQLIKEEICTQAECDLARRTYR